MTSRWVMKRPRSFPEMQTKREGRGGSRSDSRVKTYVKSICRINAGSQTHISFPEKKSSWYRPSKRERLHDQNENGHPLDFFSSSSSQTDYKHLTRHVAGKFHWLLGFALPCSASSTLSMRLKAGDASSFPNGEQFWSRAQALVLIFPATFISLVSSPSPWP